MAERALARRSVGPDGPAFGGLGRCGGQLAWPEGRAAGPLESTRSTRRAWPSPLADPAADPRLEAGKVANLLSWRRRPWRAVELREAPSPLIVLAGARPQ